MDKDPEAIIRDLEDQIRKTKLKLLEKETMMEQYEIRNENKRRVIKEMKSNLMTPEEKNILENYKRVRATLDETVEKLHETYHSFPFHDVQAYQKLNKKTQESKDNLIQMELNQQTEHINNLYNSLEIVKSIKAKKAVMEAKQVQLNQIDNKLKEINFKENQLVADFSQIVSKEIISFATALTKMQEVQNQIEEAKEQTTITKDSIKKIDQEMDKLNAERLNLEREHYVENCKQNAKPIKIEKINLANLAKITTKKEVVFNKMIQEVSPSSSESSNSVQKFVPYIEKPAKPTIDLIKTVQPIKQVPPLIPITLQSNLKMKEIEIPKETKIKQPAPEIDSASKRLPDPKIVPKTENIKILEDFVIKPAVKKNFVDLPSTSTAFPDNLSTNKFSQPTTNIRSVLKRKELSPIPLEDIQKLSPVPFKRIKYVKLIKSPDTKSIVLSSEEMFVSPPRPMENLLNDDETNSILSLDLENFDNMDSNLNELENWDLESNFSIDPQILDVETKTSIVDEGDKNNQTTDFFGTSTKTENFDFFSF